MDSSTQAYITPSLISEHPLAEIEKSLNSIFSSDYEEDRLIKTRSLLGADGKDLTEDQLEISIAQLEYLTNCWLDLFEKQLFSGKTLKELIKL